jgi:hypothetical protein
MSLRILVPAWLVATASVAAWSPPSPRTTRPAPLAEHAQAIGSALLVGVLATAVGPAACWADQIGVEKEAPTLPTGETVEVSESCVVCVCRRRPHLLAVAVDDGVRHGRRSVRKKNDPSIVAPAHPVWYVLLHPRRFA